MDRSRLLLPKAASPNEPLYHWTNWAKAITALKTNRLSQRRWEHFIDGRMLKGSSWSPDPTRWQFKYTVRFRIDQTKIPNERFEINGDKVYYQTKAMQAPEGSKDRDAAQRQADVYGSNGKNNSPETFIVGNIENFRAALISVKIDEEMWHDTQSSVYMNQAETFGDLMEEFGIKEEASQTFRMTGVA